MTIATGVAKKVLYKKEGSSTWGTKATNTGARYLRRVTSDLDLSKETYKSNEIVSHYQMADFRHGTRKVTGTINGELSPGSYWEFIQTACRRDHTTVTAITAVSLTVAVGALLNGVPSYNLSRAAGNWYTDNVRVGMVIRVTSGLANAANINRNLLVMAFTTALVIVVIPVNGTGSTAGSTGPLVAEGPTSSTVTIPGKITYVPATGHTNDSYSVEHYYSDLVQSEVFTGCRVSTVDIDLPATGMATCAVGMMGKDVETQSSQFYTTATVGPSTKGVIAAVNGVVKVGGIPVGILTGMKIQINGGMTTGQVIGSNFTPDVFAGRVDVSGQFTAYFDSVTNRDEIGRAHV